MTETFMRWKMLEDQNYQCKRITDPKDFCNFAGVTIIMIYRVLGRDLVFVNPVDNL